ncbi:uncharacterized protein LOC118470326 [Amphiprion ocellaris]|uniref:uncharacterized protein LOC118470326 n=1 Tax=Amphiprion ocellaris TaxID=80972 RepID=UPI002410E2B1|nr:uncharacterized protein LOC118470326 [Amphiprion ocellaris]XP_054861099.1 uncharacterized protein LOC118470326 [Amphiprion ocellaris]
MNLSTSSSVSHLQMCEQQPDRRHSSRTPVSVIELLPARPLSAPPPSDHLQPEARSIKPAVDQPEEQSGEEEAIYQNTLLACSYQDHSDDPQRCSELNDAESSLEGDYDVLPVRNKICEASISAEMDENIYDFPQSYRTSAQCQDLTESIYDVPSSLLRKMPEDKTDEQLEEESSWKVSFEDSSSTFSSQCI